MTDAEINKAVATIAGWTDLVCHGSDDIVGAPPSGGVRTNTPDYPNSLDAIVPVVREWIRRVADGDGTIRLHFEQERLEAEVEAYPNDMVNKMVVGESNNPARALCLALIEAHKATNEIGTGA